MKYVLLSVMTLILVSGISTAEERTSPPMPLSGGLICDTLEQAIEAISNPGVQVDGCGILRGVRIGTVTPLPVFEFNGLVFMMARYDFQGDPGFNHVQYGFYGRPQPIPASLEPAGVDA